MLYWKKSFIETKLKNLIKIEKFGQNCEILKYGAKKGFIKNKKIKEQDLVKILKFGQNSEIWSKF